jgi:tRNA pseudouridine55 synthase
MEEGLLLIDKPIGITSHDVVDRVRRVFGIRKVGHAGTLDPFATGLLLLGIGKATKTLSQYVGLDKRYRAVARLGAISDTFDTEGKIVEHTCDIPTQAQIEQAMDRFRGGYAQKAPLYSAKKIKGRKLHELVRQGQATEELRPVKFVDIFELTIIAYEWPFLTFDVHCSSGTYIRSLADDLGAALGTGAYLTELRRLTIGTFRLEDAIALDKLQKTC